MKHKLIGLIVLLAVVIFGILAVKTNMDEQADACLPDDRDCLVQQRLEELRVSISRQEGPTITPLVTYIVVDEPLQPGKTPTPTEVRPVPIITMVISGTLWVSYCNHPEAGECTPVPMTPIATEYVP